MLRSIPVAVLLPLSAYREGLGGEVNNYSLTPQWVQFVSISTPFIDKKQSAAFVE